MGPCVEVLHFVNLNFHSAKREYGLQGKRPLKAVARSEERQSFQAQSCNGVSTYLETLGLDVIITAFPTESQGKRGIAPEGNMKKRSDTLVLPRGKSASTDERSTTGRRSAPMRHERTRTGSRGHHSDSVLEAKTDPAERHIQVPVNSAADIVEARHQGRALAIDLGFEATDLTSIAAAISEVARSLVDHAEHGTITLSSIRQRGSLGLSIVASEEGSSVHNDSHTVESNCSSGHSFETDVPRKKLLMDDFEIESKRDKGIVMTLKKWVRQPAYR